MTRLVVKNSIAKYILFSLLSLIFVAAGIFILSTGNELRGKIIGWSCIIFFGLCLLVFLRQIFDHRPRIIIDKNGIYDRTLGVGIIEWNDIKNAYLNSIMGNKFISLVLNNTEKYLQKTSKTKAKLAQYNSTLGFETININLSGTNKKADEIFDLIIKQLSSVRIKNLNNLNNALELQHSTENNVVPNRSSDSQI